MKRKAWKLSLSVTGAMVLVLGLLVGDAHRRASVALDRNRADLEREVAVFRSRDRTRPSCFLETTDVNAWDHYGPALKAIGNLPNDIADLVPEIQGVNDAGEDPSPDDHALQSLFREHASILAAFEKGARCRIVDAPVFAFRPDALDCWDGEMLYLRSLLLEGPWASFFQSISIGLPSTPKPQLPPWRFLFSERITRAHALNHVSELIAGLPDLRPLPPWQRPASASNPVPEVLRLKNPLLAVLTPAIRRPLENDARSQLGRTLLRAAVAIAWFDVEKGRYPDRLQDLVPRHLPKLPVCPMTGQALRNQGRQSLVGRQEPRRRWRNAGA